MKAGYETPTKKDIKKRCISVLDEALALTEMSLWNFCKETFNSHLRPEPVRRLFSYDEIDEAIQEALSEGSLSQFELKNRKGYAIKMYCLPQNTNQLKIF